MDLINSRAYIGQFSRDGSMFVAAYQVGGKWGMGEMGGMGRWHDVVIMCRHNRTGYLDLTHKLRGGVQIQISHIAPLEIVSGIPPYLPLIACTKTKSYICMHWCTYIIHS